MTEKWKMVSIEVPEDWADAVKKFIADVDGARPEIRGGRAVDYAAFERSVEESSAELEKNAHRRLLQDLDVDAERLVIQGKPHTRVGRYESTYKTRAGPVTVMRSLYREDGRRNAETVNPVSVRAGVVGDGWLPGTAKAMAFLLQQGTSREAEKTGEQVGRLPYSRSSFERVGHEVGALYEVQHAPIEDVLIGEYRVPKEVRSISTGLDRVSVPMEEEPLSRPVGRPRKDAPKKPVERNFRMAYVGNVTLHDDKGDAIHTIRYGRMPQGDAVGLAQGLGADIASLLRQRPDLKVELLMDGAPEMHNLLSPAVKEVVAPGTQIYDLVDLGHVVEKLSPAAAVIFGATSGATVHRWKMKLLNVHGAVWQILTELQVSEMETSAKDCPVHAAITYLTNNGERMNYAEARELGLPIGSGNTEATCKSLFEIRFKRAGSRWKETTGSHIVHLRALALSDRWDAGVDRALDTLRAPVRPAA